MKKILIVLLCMVAAIGATAQEGRDEKPQIPLKYLRHEDKPIVLMFTASWCGPCNYMKNKIFKEEKVVARLKDVNLLLMDVDSSEGRAFFEAYCGPKAGVPQLLLMDRDQKIIAIKVGALNASDFIKFINQAF